MKIGTKRRNDLATVEQLILANLPFSIHMAKKWFSKFPGESDELIGEAKLALVRAAQTYDFRPGVKFITYAAWWINQRLKKFELRHTGAMPIPDKQWPRGVRAPVTVSLDVRIDRRNSGDPNDFSVGDSLGVDEPGFELAEQRKLLQQTIEAANLTPIERLILRERFFAERPLIEIGRDLCRSRERIRQIEMIALWKLKRAAGLPVSVLNPSAELGSSNSIRQRQRQYWRKANARRRGKTAHEAKVVEAAEAAAPLAAQAQAI